MERGSKRFTIIELLVVISIIVILASILLPALRNAKEKAKQMLCLGNHRQFALVLNNYTSDFNDWWMCKPDVNITARMEDWPYTLIQNGYIAQGRSTHDTVLHCPALNTEFTLRTMHTDYIINGMLSNGDLEGGLAEAEEGQMGCNNSQIPEPSAFSILFDRCDWPSPNLVPVSTRELFDRATQIPKFGERSISNPTMNAYAHVNGSNYLFADGHAEPLSWRSIRYRMFILRTSSYFDDWNLLP